MIIKRYRKKPVEVTGVLFNGSNHQDIKDFVGIVHEFPADIDGWDERQNRVYNSIQGSWNEVNPGDAVLRGLVGEYYPCSPDALKASYDEVSVDPSFEEDVHFFEAGDDDPTVCNVCGAVEQDTVHPAGDSESS